MTYGRVEGLGKTKVRVGKRNMLLSAKLITFTITHTQTGLNKFLNYPINEVCKYAK